MALVLCIGLLPASARAETQKPWDTETDWTELTDAHSGQTLNGKYYLAGDVAITTSIYFSVTVTLDLNGHTLSFNGSDGANAFFPRGSNANLILQDSGGSGHIDCGNKARGVYIDSGGSFTMNGGIIQNCTPKLGDDANGGGVFVEGGGSFIMNGGTIQNCSTVNGGGVYIDSGGSFTMNGGSFTGNSANNGPDVLLAGSTMYANGGSVEHISTSRDTRKGTITRSDDATDYTTFTGTVSGNGTINDKAKLTVTFESNGGSVVAEQKVLKGQKADSPADPTRAGYTFGDWFTDPDFAAGTECDLNTEPVMSSMTLYAKWIRNQYAVTFDSDGGSDVAAQTVYHGTAAAEPADPGRSGYRFDGWYLDGEKYDFATPVTGPITLVAAWTPLVNNSSVTGATHGTVELSPRFAETGDPVTLTATPDAGYALSSLTVTDRSGREVELTKNPDGTYSFRMPRGGVNVKAVFTAQVSFVDVPESKYFHDAVIWAAANGITGGTDATHFSPYAPCSRAHAVTFLYRSAIAMGLDVSVGEDTNILSYNDAFDIPEYAIPAFQWACGAGILTGNNGNLNPGAPCTRAQIAAFLWRFAKAAGMDVSVGEDTNILSYNDAFDVPEYAIPAFQWACGESVVTGNNGSLDPNTGCTRAQIVTFLYRLLAE